MEKQAAACFLTNQKNILYLTGFSGISPHERESTMLVTQTEAWLFVPRMYAERANHITTQGVQIVADLPGGFLGTWTNYAPQGTILVESEHLSVADYHRLQRKTAQELLPTQQLVEPLRIIKTAQEIAAMRKAASIADKTWHAVQSFVRTHIDRGIREHDVVEEIRRTSTALGSEGYGFDPIVAAGPGSAEPHYISENKPITRGMALLVDMGFVVDGYTSDCTRTMFLGTPSPEFQRIYSLVQEVQYQCLEACKPGTSTSALYKQSQEYFSTHGVADLYLHSLGHGVGLDIHEAPRLGNTQDTILAPGMVITIEPGLYLTGKFGVRIEDLVLITKDGYEVLTTSSKELVSLV